MSDYIKELEKQNEELRQRLANAELIQDIVKFTEAINLNEYKVSQEAIDDLKGMFGVDMESTIKQYIMEEVDKKFKQRFIKL